MHVEPANLVWSQPTERGVLVAERDRPVIARRREIMEPSMPSLITVLDRRKLIAERRNDTCLLSQLALSRLLDGLTRVAFAARKIPEPGEVLGMSGALEDEEGFAALEDDFADALHDRMKAQPIIY